MNAAAHYERERALSALYELPDTLDAGIARFVEILHSNGVETYESCQGGPGHCSPEPFVRFHGNSAAGWRALQVAMDHALPVAELRRFWAILDGEPVGPTWEMTFYKQADGKNIALWWYEFSPPVAKPQEQ